MILPLSQLERNVGNAFFFNSSVLTKCHQHTCKGGSAGKRRNVPPEHFPYEFQQPRKPCGKRLARMSPSWIDSLVWTSCSCRSNSCWSQRSRLIPSLVFPTRQSLRFFQLQIWQDEWSESNCRWEDSTWLCIMNTACMTIYKQSTADCIDSLSIKKEFTVGQHSWRFVSSRIASFSLPSLLRSLQ